MNTLTKVGLFIVVLLVGSIGAYLTRPIPNPEIIQVERKQLYELTYEWALYRKTTALLYAKVHHVTEEQAQEYLNGAVKEAVAKQFEPWYIQQTREKK